MEDIQLKTDLINQIIEISKESGEAILKVYNTNFDFQIKDDLSPLTKADILSHKIICERLKALTPNIPILSEESSYISFEERSKWNQYWLIDPLDGTKEFINRNGEFTVNIALIRNNSPVFGVIHVPTNGTTYWGSLQTGSHQLNCGSESNELSVSKDYKGPLKIVSSRSHPSKELSKILQKIKDCEIINVGSSLKFCLVASGEAHCYPRLGPTSEWDTAAGEIIARSAGAMIVDLRNRELKYNSRESYLNPPFLVSNNSINKEKILSFI